MLPAQYRMTTAAEFGATVKYGVRAVQPDMVLHVRREPCGVDSLGVCAPQVGLVVAKSVGNAVVRHQVARRLRHVVVPVLNALAPGERVVIRALPSSRHAASSRLELQLRAGLRRAHQVMERSR